MKVIKNILEILDSVGIEEVIFEPTEEGTRLRGSNKDQNVVVFHEIPDEIVESPMGLQSVKGLLSRINLFDDDKANMDFEVSGDSVANILIKQGRKKASYKCNEPEHIVAPKRIPGEMNMDSPLSFNGDYVDYLGQAFSSMGYTGEKAERSISIGIKDSTMSINVYDGEDDSFNDNIEVESDDVDTASWEVVPFQRVMKQSVLGSTDRTARFTITEHGVAVFDVAGINIIVAPIA